MTMLDENMMKRSCSLSGLGLAKSSSKAPRRFLCSLTKKVMADPVTTASGYNFERAALAAWLQNNGQRCPKTGQPCSMRDIQSNALLQWEILYWQRKTTGETSSTAGEAHMVTPPSNRSQSLNNLCRFCLLYTSPSPRD